MALSKLNKSQRFAARRAFSLVELLMSIGVMAILVGLSLPSLHSSRQRAIEIYCVNNSREIGRHVVHYATDFKDRYPALASDDPATLRTRQARLHYSNQVWTIFASAGWIDYTGLLPELPTIRYRADTPSRRPGWGYPVDFHLSSSFYMRPDYLNPLLPPSIADDDVGAQLQSIADVTFPDAKVGVYEAEVWHAFEGSGAIGSRADGLSYHNSPGPGAVWFLDGHAGLFAASKAAPALVRGEWWGHCPFGTTVFGVRGRDRN